MGKILSTLMSSRTTDFCRRGMWLVYKSDATAVFCGFLRIFPQTCRLLLRTLRSHCGPVGRGEIQKYRTPQNTERARYWLPLASLHPDNSSRCEGCSEQWVASVGYQMKTNHVLMLCEHVRRKALASIFNWRERKGCQMF